jgi:hypothetical protein
VIFDAAARRPRSATMVFCHGAIPPKLRERAIVIPNLVVTSPTEAIIGGREGSWLTSTDIPEAFEGGEFLLGDFARLSRYLATLTQVGFDGPS